MKPVVWVAVSDAGGRTTNSINGAYQAPKKIEFVGGIFDSKRERLNVLGMFLDNLGIDKVVRFGKLEDWKSAVADLEKRPAFGNQP